MRWLPLARPAAPGADQVAHETWMARPRDPSPSRLAETGSSRPLTATTVSRGLRKVGAAPTGCSGGRRRVAWGSGPKKLRRMCAGPRAKLGADGAKADAGTGGGVPHAGSGRCCGTGGSGEGGDGLVDLSSKRTFSFAVWGDTPYSANEARAQVRMIDEINASGVDFLVMVGDIVGGEKCDNALYTRTRDTFNSFTAPLVYTPGDKEWTDCHTFAQDPVERLAYIRQTMFATSRSFGRRAISLVQQRPSYPENARWSVGPVLWSVRAQRRSAR